jgi:hypothetical protein
VKTSCPCLPVVLAKVCTHRNGTETGPKHGRKTRPQATRTCFHPHSTAFAATALTIPARVGEIAVNAHSQCPWLRLDQQESKDKSRGRCIARLCLSPSRRRTLTPQIARMFALLGGTPLAIATPSVHEINRVHDVTREQARGVASESSQSLVAISFTTVAESESAMPNPPGCWVIRRQRMRCQHRPRGLVIPRLWSSGPLTQVLPDIIPFSRRTSRLMTPLARRLAMRPARVEQDFNRLSFRIYITRWIAETNNVDNTKLIDIL